MAKRGRKPLPLEVKLAKQVRSDRVNLLAPPAGPAPEPPADLSPVARKEWDRLVAALDPLRVLGPGDFRALAVICETFARLQQLSEAVKEKGLLIDGGARGLKLNPAFEAEERLRAELVKYLAEFGGSPSSRSRFATAKPPEDELDSFVRNAPHNKAS